MLYTDIEEGLNGNQAINVRVIKDEVPTESV